MNALGAHLLRSLLALPERARLAYKPHPLACSLTQRNESNYALPYPQR